MAESPTPTVKRRGSRKAVNAGNLAELGAERLAELLIEIAEAQPATKRRLRMELAGEVGSEDLAAQIGKRLATIEVRRSRVHWRKYREFLRDLDVQRSMIAGRLAELDPKAAHELMWRLVGLAPRLFAQVDDRKGGLEELMRTAVEDLGALATLARPDWATLAERTYEALRTDSAEVLDGLVPALAPALGPEGTAALRARIADSGERLSRVRETFRVALQQIADHEGDADGWIAAVPARERTRPGVGAAIARRLLAGSRVDEALAALEAAAPTGGLRGAFAGPTADELHDWEGARIDALDAAGRPEEAQALRWRAFERDLSAPRLRDYLKRLPDFDDVVAEERALAHAVAHPRFEAALTFLMVWPAWPAAAELIRARHAEITVPDVEAMHAVVRALESRHPLAASLVLRAMVHDAVRRLDRDTAARLLEEASSLAAQVPDFSGFEGHEAFEARVRRAARL